MRRAASIEGTRDYATRAVDQGIPTDAYRHLGRSGLVVSALGFGTYRVDNQTKLQAAALHKALLAGVNLIDTSTNYTDGSSEVCIGNILPHHRREEIVVVSKVGYVQGRALATSKMREQQGSPYPDMVKYADGCWHCIHPDFIAHQLGQSLARLRVEKVDVYLLHNPEYFFMDAVKRRRNDIETLRAEFYARIGRAFAHLENEVEKGRIAYYGISSNTFGARAGDPQAVSLEAVWKVAEQMRSDHHFAVAQLPANLFESGPILTRNDATASLTALDFAEQHGIAVLVNRPLNAFDGEQLVRLADSPDRSIASDIHARIDMFLPAVHRGQSLSRKVLAILMNTKGVTCVLNGMRHPDYVDDSLGALRIPKFGVDTRAFQAVKAPG